MIGFDRIPNLLDLGAQPPFNMVEGRGMNSTDAFRLRPFGCDSHDREPGNSRGRSKCLRLSSVQFDSRHGYDINVRYE